MTEEEQKIEESIQVVVAEVTETPNAWRSTTEPMTYNRFMKLKDEHSEIDWKFEGLRDASGALLETGKTAAGNSSGSREGYAHAYRYVAQETG